ncbi:MAG: glycosyltransferase family 4 protein [Bryobacteraceae bacterium]|nr:glycosyltransferase family 4 protein [Bryobacteraceae bacterium]
MKALQVLAGGAWGGGSVVVLSIVKAMIARGDKVWVVALDPETQQHFRDAGAIPVDIPGWRRSLSPLDVVPLFHLYNLCRREKFDLVATHTSKGGMLGRLAARMAGVPNIIHYVHGFGFHQFTPALVKQVYVACEKLGARCADLMITVGEEHRQIAMKLGIERGDRIRTILNGIDVDRFLGVDRVGARRQFGFGPDEIILGSVGRLATQKGFEYMIDALPEILAEHPRVRLVLSGEGELEAALRTRAAERGVGAKVTFLGFRREVPALLAAFDVFVHPSLWEGLSISLMEAMVAGCPIVCSRIPGNVEMIRHGETGLFSEPAMPASIAAQLCDLLADRERATDLGLAARHEGIERFSVERMVDENIAAYDSVVLRKTPWLLNSPKTLVGSRV